MKKVLYLLSIAIVAILGMCACGNDKTDDPQPQKTDIRESILGDWEGLFTVSVEYGYQQDDDPYMDSHFKVGIKKNAKKDYVDMYMSLDGETVVVPVKIVESDNTAINGIIERQWNETFEEELYGVNLSDSYYSFRYNSSLKTLVFIFAFSGQIDDEPPYTYTYRYYGYK